MSPSLRPEKPERARSTASLSSLQSQGKLPTPSARRCSLGLGDLDNSDDDREASREPRVSGAEARYETVMAALIGQLKKRGSFRLAFQVIQEAHSKLT
jgi:hypothetical protein